MTNETEIARRAALTPAQRQAEDAHRAARANAVFPEPETDEEAAEDDGDEDEGDDD